MTDTEAEEIARWRSLLEHQGHIALVNYDTAQANQESLKKLLKIAAEQSRQIDVLLSTVRGLLEVLESRC